MRLRCLAATAAVLATAGLASASAAQASFHLIKVREVFPGSVAHPDSAYVELQMYASGQNLVQHGSLNVYGPTGTVLESFTPSNQVAQGGSQSTVLIADSEYAAQFPAGPTPDFTTPNLNLSPAGGAVCWPQTEAPFDDCASWGNFTGQAKLASKDTAPAPVVPDGMAIRRSIAGGSCATMLEDADDTNNSSADFALVSPAPRDNASAVTEVPCPPPEEPPKPRSPQTTLQKTPPRRTQDPTPTFRFRSSEAGSTFQCRVDRKPFRGCRSPFTTKRLTQGRHTFSVRARDAAGELDATPAKFTFTVLRR